MIAYENKDGSILIITDASPLFYCGICHQSHRIDRGDVNETTDKQGYVVQCPETGQLVDWDKGNDVLNKAVHNEHELVLSFLNHYNKVKSDLCRCIECSALENFERELIDAEYHLRVLKKGNKEKDCVV
jgi:hypothetical protein